MREDRVLYLNVPAARSKLRRLAHLEAAARNPGPARHSRGDAAEQVRKATTLAQLRLVDPKTGGLEQFLHLRVKASWVFASRSASPSYVVTSTAAPCWNSLQQLPLTGLLSTGYVFFRAPGS